MEHKTEMVGALRTYIS